MRTAFAILVLGVLAATGWALWDDWRPEWRRYQEELVLRETVRLEEELLDARRELERPEVQAELMRLEERIQAHSADSSAIGSPAAADLRLRLAGAEQERDERRAALRLAEQQLNEAPVVEQRESLREQLADAQNRYAALTGSWPPDTLRIASLWTERDSLADALVAIEGPAQEIRDAVEEARARTEELRAALGALTGARDSLDAELARWRAPVTKRESALARLRNHTPRIHEVSFPGSAETARCPTCHGTLEDPPGVHPALAAAKVFRDAPCTVCHGGDGRALDVAGAHRRLLAGSDAGPRSIRGRIALLTGPDATARHQAMEELRTLTGVDPADWANASTTAESDSAVAAQWAEWWTTTRAYFEPGEAAYGEDADSPLLGVGIDPWLFSARGRALRYVGSRECLRCHEVRHREHSRRWLTTKFRSIERLVEEADPGPCLECHATGLDPVTGLYAEPGVTCEGCHGPGERYNEMMVVGQDLLGQGDELRGNALLDFSSRLAREAVSGRSVPGDNGAVNVCVHCHRPNRHRDGGPGFLERVGKPREGAQS